MQGRGGKRNAAARFNKEKENMMYKTLIMTSALALPGLAGQSVCVAPAPAVQEVVRTCADSPWSMEIGGAYNFAMRDLLKHRTGSCKALDTMGGDFTLVHRNSARDSMYVRLGYGYGGDSSAGFTGFGDDNIKLRSHTFTLTTGYRYTRELTESAGMYLGAGIGVVNQSVKMKYRNGGFDRRRDSSFSAHDAAWGFGMEAEAGLRYRLCPCWDMFLAYRFSANTARNSLGDRGDARLTDFNRNHRQFYHGITAGVAFKF